MAKSAINPSDTDRTLKEINGVVLNLVSPEKQIDIIACNACNQ